MIHSSRQGFDVRSLVAPFPSEGGYCISQSQTADWPLESRDYFERETNPTDVISSLPEYNYSNLTS